jgi:hypothetical protein
MNKKSNSKIINVIYQIKKGFGKKPFLLLQWKKKNNSLTQWFFDTLPYCRHCDAVNS